MGMLVLTRRRDQTVVVGEGAVRFTILGVNNRGEVRVGIDADRAVPIHREEVYNQIKAQADAKPTAKSQAVAPVQVVPAVCEAD